MTAPSEREISRRGFLAGVGGVLASGAASPGRWWRREAFDTLIQGGTVYDPASGLATPMDVGILDGRIAEVAATATDTARRTIDARGMIVTPGLIDIHVHVYPGVPTLGIDPDIVGVGRGVTTLLDAGSSGATTFPAFRDHVIRSARTRVRALLNMSSVGMTAPNELALLSYVDPDAVVRTIEANRDTIVGIKVRMLAGIENDEDVEVMRRTREAADRTGVPVTLHIGGQTAPLPEIIRYLRPGDVLTHAFRRVGNILDANGRVYPEVREALAGGIWLDIGHGMGNLDFDVAERIMDQGVVPRTISSDVHDGNVAGPVFDLPTNMSKFMALGMSLEEVVAASTDLPGRIFPFAERLGTLSVGAPADVSVFELVEGDYGFTDATGNHRRGTHMLTPRVAFRNGAPYGVARG